MKGVVKKQKIKSSAITGEKEELIEMVANKFVGVIGSSASTVMNDKNSESWNRIEIRVVLCPMAKKEGFKSIVKSTEKTKLNGYGIIKRLFQDIRKQTSMNNG